MKYNKIRVLRNYKSKGQWKHFSTILRDSRVLKILTMNKCLAADSKVPENKLREDLNR